MVKNKDRNLTTKTPSSPRNTKKHQVNVLFFLVFLGVLVVKHLKLTDYPRTLGAFGKVFRPLGGRCLLG